MLLDKCHACAPGPRLSIVLHFIQFGWYFGGRATSDQTAKLIIFKLTLWCCLFDAKRKTKRTSVFPNWKIWFVDGHFPHFWATILIPLGIPVFLAWEHMETDLWVDMGYGYGLKQLDNKMLTHAQRIVEVYPTISTWVKSLCQCSHLSAFKMCLALFDLILWQQSRSQHWLYTPLCSHGIRLYLLYFLVLVIYIYIYTYFPVVSWKLTS